MIQVFSPGIRTARAMIFGGLLLLNVAYADEIATLTGRYYRNATVTRIEPDGITITTRNGVKKIPFSELPADMKAKYGYDAAKEAAYVSSVKQAAEAWTRQKAAGAATQQLIQGIVFENTPQGVLLRHRVESGNTVHRSEWRGDKHMSGDFPTFVDAFYLVKRHPNADVLPLGTPIAIIAVRGGWQEIVDGKLADVYTFVRDSTPVK